MFTLDEVNSFITKGLIEPASSNRNVKKSFYMGINLVYPV
jgi:hypothetical protein